MNNTNILIKITSNMHLSDKVRVVGPITFSMQCLDRHGIIEIINFFFNIDISQLLYMSLCVPMVFVLGNRVSHMSFRSQCLL